MTTQLALPLSPAGDEYDPDAAPCAQTETNATLLAIAGQTRRRMWGRRSALHALRWRAEHATRRGDRGAPTGEQRAEIDRLGAHIDSLTHLNDHDREAALG